MVGRAHHVDVQQWADGRGSELGGRTVGKQRGKKTVLRTSCPVPVPGISNLAPGLRWPAVPVPQANVPVPMPSLDLARAFRKFLPLPLASITHQNPKQVKV